MAEPIVGFPLDGVPKDVVCFLQGGKLCLCAVVVVQVRVIDSDLLAKRLLDIVLGGVLGYVEQIVEVIAHESSGALLERPASLYVNGDYSFNVPFDRR